MTQNFHDPGPIKNGKKWPTCQKLDFPIIYSEIHSHHTKMITSIHRTHSSDFLIKKALSIS